MAQQDWIALALGMGFVMGWAVCWMQESHSARVRVLRRNLRLEKVKVRALQTETDLLKERHQALLLVLVRVMSKAKD